MAVRIVISSSSGWSSPRAEALLADSGCRLIDSEDGGITFIRNVDILQSTWHNFQMSPQTSIWITHSIFLYTLFKILTTLLQLHILACSCLFDGCRRYKTRHFWIKRLQFQRSYWRNDEVVVCVPFYWNAFVFVYVITVIFYYYYYCFIGFWSCLYVAFFMARLRPGVTWWW